MKVFSLPFRYNIDKQGFDYHPKCKSLEISLVAFADDLFIPSAGNTTPFQHIKQTLDEFQSPSGLQPNLGKCQVFYTGMSNEQCESLLVL